MLKVLFTFYLSIEAFPIGIISALLQDIVKSVKKKNSVIVKMIKRIIVLKSNDINNLILNRDGIVCIAIVFILVIILSIVYE